jgi:iron complex transport system ATP-binding protein
VTIRFEDLSYSYGRIAALRDVSVEATPGAVTAVIGPNAAGKSTLLRCAVGSLRPARGQVTINGTPAHRMRARELASLIAYVPQRAVVSAGFTVRQVIELGRYALAADPSRIDQAIDEFDLHAIADRPYPALSVGQQQRVTLARAMAQLAPAGHLLLDEPTSAMDLRHVQSSMDIVRAAARRGATVLMAVHDLLLASRWADVAWVILDGRLVHAGAVGDVMTEQNLQGAFGIEFHRVMLPGGQIAVIPARQAGATAARIQP